MKLKINTTIDVNRIHLKRTKLDTCDCSSTSNHGHYSHSCSSRNPKVWIEFDSNRHSIIERELFEETFKSPSELWQFGDAINDNCRSIRLWDSSKDYSHLMKE